jgi:hypothetical protein
MTSIKNWIDNFKLVSTESLKEIKNSLEILNNDNKNVPIANGHLMFRKEYPEIKTYLVMINEELKLRND